jgi:superfamily II DNA/RNA helicase
MGFSAPSKIQETALPTLLADPPQNMIAQSQSGTGKTAAFVLAMLSRVDRSKPYPQARKFRSVILTNNTKLLIIERKKVYIVKCYCLIAEITISDDISGFVPVPHLRVGSSDWRSR